MQFADNSEPSSPDEARPRRHRRNHSDPESDAYDSEGSDRRRHRRRKHRDRKEGRDRRDRGDPRGNENDSPSIMSDETEYLPDRFDRDGRKKPERGDDPLADKIEDFLGGKGSAGKLFKNITEGFLGGGDKDRDRDRRRRSDY